MTSLFVPNEIDEKLVLGLHACWLFLRLSNVGSKLGDANLLPEDVILSSCHCCCQRLELDWKGIGKRDAPSELLNLVCYGVDDV